MRRIAVLAAAALMCAVSSFAQKNEVSLSMGAMVTGDQDENLLLGLACTISNPNCNRFIASTRTGVAIEATFARQLISFGPASLGLEIPLVAVPSRDVKLMNPGSAIAPVTNSLSSFFLTPSARVEFLHSKRISPFFTFGTGLEHFNSGANSAGTAVFSNSNHWALQFGGGSDFNTPLPHLTVRAEVRDFWGRGPLASANLINVSPDNVHNVFAGGGVVLKF